MSVDLSTLLCTVEVGKIKDSSLAWSLCSDEDPQGMAPADLPPMAREVSRLATQWPVATGRPLRVR